MQNTKYEFSPDKPLYMIDLSGEKDIKEVHLDKKEREYITVYYKKGACSKYYLFFFVEYNEIDKYFEGEYPACYKLFTNEKDAENYLKKIEAISFIKHNTSWEKLSLDSLLKIQEEIKKSEEKKDE